MTFGTLMAEEWLRQTLIFYFGIFVLYFLISLFVQMKFKIDPVQNGRFAYPVVSGNYGMSYKINYGDKQFKYIPPCGYRPFSDLATTAGTTGNAHSGVLTTNCWTCQGKCASYDNINNLCSSFVSGGPSFDVFKEWGMLEGGSVNRVM